MSHSLDSNSFDVDRWRRRFPALDRAVDGQPAVFFDGPAGSQVPDTVIDAVVRYFVETNANHGGLFETSRRSDALLESAHEAVADLLGCGDPGEVVFGANMTSLTLALSRSLGKTWAAGDEIVVAGGEHDANFTPWVLAARDAGATVRQVTIDKSTCSIDLDDLAGKLTDRTRLVAAGCASNAVGTINPIDRIVQLAHDHGALVFLDAVHYAPHRAIDVAGWGCDFLACSAYKFFGPHVGVLWGRRALLEELPAYKLRPAPDRLPGRWMTGTQSHEGIAGTAAAVEYLAELGREHDVDAIDRRAALESAFRAISAYEQQLAASLLTGLSELPTVKVWGIADLDSIDCRVPTVSITHNRLKPAELAEFLGTRGIFVWHGNFYALPLTETLGLEPDGLVRIGLLHYNTAEEIGRLLTVLAELQ